MHSPVPAYSLRREPKTIRRGPIDPHRQRTKIVQGLEIFISPASNASSTPGSRLMRIPVTQLRVLEAEVADLFQHRPAVCVAIASSSMSRNEYIS
jgi:hypothetical protein